MSWETAGSAGTVAATLISLVAMAIAIWQAKIARQSAGSAKDQADAAREQVAAAKRANAISEASLRQQELTLLQNAKKLLREVADQIESAINCALFDGKPADGPTHRDRASALLHELRHLPMGSYPKFEDHIDSIKEQCQTLFFGLQAVDYVIWDKREIMGTAMRNRSEILEAVQLVIGNTDRIIAARQEHPAE